MSHSHTPPLGLKRTRSVLLTAATLLTALFVTVPPAGAASADIGFRDFSFAGKAATTPTKYSNQHKLWFNDGIWWAAMFNPSTSHFDIYRLNNATQTWSDTGVIVDDRDTSHVDVLWSGGHLYVAGVTNLGTSSPRVNRLTYNTTTNTYSVDVGFPKTITQTVPTGSPGVSIVRDSVGRLWVGYMQATGVGATAQSGPWLVTVSQSTDSGATWSAPETLPGQVPGIGAATGSPDGEDIVQLVAFGSGAASAVGAFWAHEVGNETTATNNGFYFSSRLDSNATLGATSWSATPELALGGAYTADNHLSVTTDETGHVLAVVKTNRNDDPGANGDDPLIAVLKRVSAGSWETHIVLHVSTVGRPTRPILLVDAASHTANVYFSDPEFGLLERQSANDLLQVRVTERPRLRVRPRHAGPQELGRRPAQRRDVDFPGRDGVIRHRPAGRGPQHEAVPARLRRCSVQDSACGRIQRLARIGQRAPGRGLQRRIQRARRRPGTGTSTTTAASTPLSRTQPTRSARRVRSRSS